MTSISKFYKQQKINEDIYAIFNSLIMDVIFIDKLYIEKIKKFEISLEEKLLLNNSGIYIENDEFDENNITKLNNYVNQNMKKVDTIYVIISNSCNLKCKYCFIENNSKNNSETLHMTTDVIDKFLIEYSQYLKSNNIKQSKIIFYGGEPLTNFKNIEYFINKANSLFSFEYSMVTNGTLLDENKIKLIKNYNIGLGLSIDGPKSINDLNRIFKTNNLSVYDNIINKIEMIKKENIPFALSITISQQFLDNQDLILDWIENLGINNVNYNLLHFTESSNNLQKYYKDATEFLIKSFERLHKLNINDDRINRKIDSFINKKFIFSDCAAVSGTQLTLKPNGDVTVCQGNVKTSENILGNILKDKFTDIINSKERQIWWQERTLLKSECLDCESIFICGRGCLLQCELALGNKSNLDTGFCIHSKTTLKWLLKNLYYSNL